MTLETLQKRIKTTQDLRNIVSTMKALSSVSILQYDQAAASLKGYRKNIRDGFHALMKRGQMPPLPEHPKEGKTLVILIGTDSGLVGRFNNEIVTKARDEIHLAQKHLSDVLFLSVGKRMAVLAENAKMNLIGKYAISNSIKVVNSLAGTIILRMYEAMHQYKVTRVVMFYHYREQGTSVSLKKTTLFPVSRKAYDDLRKKKWKTNNVPLVTLPARQLLDALIKEYLMIELSAALTYSLAAEHHTRMINMQNAEKNIDESLEKMNLEYQQKRQDAITEELIDVVSGAEALTPAKAKRK